MAEVLVTLTILGILASIIVPNVIQQYQKRVTITKLKKAYSTLQKAATNLASSTGCVGKDISCTGLLTKDNIPGEWGGNDTNKEFPIKIAKLMGFEENSVSEPTPLYYALLADEKNKNEKKKKYPIYQRFVTDKDGIRYVFSVSTSSLSDCSLNATETKYGLGVTVYISDNKKLDENNVFVSGRNYFQFLIHDNFDVSPSIVSWHGKICPAFTRELEIDAQCAAPPKGNNETSNSCAAKIIKDGWKINY